MRSRVKKIFDRLSPGPDVLLLANGESPQVDTSFFYLFDVLGGSFEGSSLVARPDGSITVLTSPLEAETARQAAAKDPSVDIQIAASSEAASSAFRRLIDESARVALNYRELTHEGFEELHKALPSARFSDASDAIQRTRRVKEDTEVARIEKSAAIASEVAREIPGLLKEGITELELAGEIEYGLTRHGAAGRSFDTIVGFGPHSAEPHFTPGSARLRPGQSVVCDFGALNERYISDLTRPFHLGPVDPELARVHATVLRAQQAALDILRPGVRACDLHLAAERVIDESPWKGRFTHRLGHSIGLAVHDGFSVNRETVDPIEAGETFTVEPGIYLPGRGGVRIEDDVLMTNRGFRFLTTAPREYLGPDA